MQSFPPSPEDVQRRAGYQAAYDLYKGRTFGSTQGLGTKARYHGASLLSGRLREIDIVENFPRTITQVSSALLFGRAPTFTVGVDPKDPTDPAKDDEEAGQKGTHNSPAQLALNEIVRENALVTLLKESAISQSKDGDSVFRVRWGQRAQEKEPRVIIEELPAANYFVTTLPHNPREVLSESVAWLVPKPGETGRGFLCCQKHGPGVISEAAYLCSTDSSLTDGRLRVGQQVDLDCIYPPNMVPADEIEHPYPGSLLFHIPNERINTQYFGDSDFQGLETVFEAINNRISRIDSNLDYHANPKLVGLPGLMGPDGVIDLKNLQYIEAAATELGKYLPRYVTWDGQIGGSLAQLEHLLETLCRIARMAPAFFGLDKAGSIESGIAMRMRFFATTSKIDDKQSYYDPVLKRMLRAALDLHAEKKKVNTQGNVEIFWRHGLPIDDTEKTRIVVSRVASQIMSRETGICHLDGVSRPEAQKEMALIQSEQDQVAKAMAADGPDASKDPAIDPLTAQEQSAGSSLPAKMLKSTELTPA